jgi:hypothetical protein
VISGFCCEEALNLALLGNYAASGGSRMGVQMIIGVPAVLSSVTRSSVNVFISTLNSRAAEKQALVQHNILMWLLCCTYF